MRSSRAGAERSRPRAIAGGDRRARVSRRPPGVAAGPRVTQKNLNLTNLGKCFSISAYLRISASKLQFILDSSVRMFFTDFWCIFTVVAEAAYRSQAEPLVSNRRISACKILYTCLRYAFVFSTVSSTKRHAPRIGYVQAWLRNAKGPDGRPLEYELRHPCGIFHFLPKCDN